eukprot:6468711-Amphidinium_carterae.2
MFGECTLPSTNMVATTINMSFVKIVVSMWPVCDLAWSKPVIEYGHTKDRYANSQDVLRRL